MSGEQASQPEVIAADAIRLAREALAEDGPRDITTEVTVPAASPGTAVIEFRSAGIVAGLPTPTRSRACGLRRIQGPHGRAIGSSPEAVIGTMDGNLAPILRAERPLLNLLQRAWGIATATRTTWTRWQALAPGSSTPGRPRLVSGCFDVHAVLAGGGMPTGSISPTTVMVKDNHWQALEETGIALARGAGRQARRAG